MSNEQWVYKITMSIKIYQWWLFNKLNNNKNMPKKNSQQGDETLIHLSEKQRMKIFASLGDKNENKIIPTQSPFKQETSKLLDLKKSVSFASYAEKYWQF